MSSSGRKIIHVDMDCFYAAVETKHQPELAGRPMGVGGHSQGRGVLCTANYEARKFGVHSAMASAQAARLCPDLIILPPNFALYKKESESVREIFARFTHVAEPLSLDEAYLDVTNSPHFGGSATLIANEIRRLIQSELSLTASAGVAPNKFLAKIASDWNKPNGLFVVKPSDIDAFVQRLRVEKIHGVGKVTAQKMHERGLMTCGDIQRHSEEQLHKWFGSRGESLYRLARGIDDREVETQWERKSLSVEETFHKDIRTLPECLGTIPGLYEDWQKRIAKSDYRERIRGFAVKVKFFDFKSTTHEVSSKSFPSIKQFEELFCRVWAKRAAPVRLIGLGARLANPAEEPLQLSFAF